MHNLYKVTYDIRLDGSRRYLAHNNPNGWSNAYVVCRGDALTACAKVEKDVKKYTYDGRRVSHVKILTVEQVATNILV